MARNFSGATDKLTVTNYTAMNGLSTVSMSIWSRRTGEGANGAGRLMAKGDSVAWSAHLVGIIGSPVGHFKSAGWTTGGEWTWVGHADNAWGHTLITYNNSAVGNAPIAYENGVSTTVTLVTAPTGTYTNDTADLVIGNVSDVRNWAGDLAEVAVWNVILTAAEAATLGTNKCRALNVRPASLVCYVSMLGDNSPELNFAGASNATVTGATKSTTHPTVVDCHYGAALKTLRPRIFAPGLAR